MRTHLIGMAADTYLPCRADQGRFVNTFVRHNQVQLLRVFHKPADCADISSQDGTTQLSHGANGRLPSDAAPNFNFAALTGRQGRPCRLAQAKCCSYMYAYTI